MLRFLPREAATVQAILGDEARWGDTEYLLALVADTLAHHGWMYGSVHFKNMPKRPPLPVRRPGDVSTVPGVTLTRNLTERTTVTAGSLTLDEMRAAVARQTGTPNGVEVIDAS